MPYLQCSNFHVQVVSCFTLLAIFLLVDCLVVFFTSRHVRISLFFCLGFPFLSTFTCSFWVSLCSLVSFVLLFVCFFFLMRFVIFVLLSSKFSVLFPFVYLFVPSCTFFFFFCFFCYPLVFVQRSLVCLCSFSSPWTSCFFDLKILLLEACVIDGRSFAVTV